MIATEMQMTRTSDISWPLVCLLMAVLAYSILFSVGHRTLAMPATTNSGKQCSGDCGCRGVGAGGMCSHLKGHSCHCGGK